MIILAISLIALILMVSIYLILKYYLYQRKIVKKLCQPGVHIVSTKRHTVYDEIEIYRRIDSKIKKREKER
ncbi:MAG: hypothetical protein RBQ97_11955 [Acholeplasma sp.]|nr:hypothetical protein [Acholeplasma sp.]